MKSRRAAREAALQALYQCDTLGEWTPATIELFFQHFRPEDHDDAPVESLVSTDILPVSEKNHARAKHECDLHPDAHLTFTQQLISGVIEHFYALDERIGAASTHWTVQRMARVDRNILRVATYEMMFVADIPLSVSINEAIEIAKRFGGPESPTFINGVLDKLAHTLADLPLAISKVVPRANELKKAVA